MVMVMIEVHNSLPTVALGFCEQKVHNVCFNGAKEGGNPPFSRGLPYFKGILSPYQLPELDDRYFRYGCAIKQEGKTTTRVQ